MILCSIVFAKSIMFLRDGDLYLSSLDGKNIELFLDAEQEISYYDISYDNKLIAFEVNIDTNNKILIYDILTKNIKHVENDAKILEWTKTNNLIFKKNLEDKLVNYDINVSSNEVLCNLPYPIFDNKNGMYYSLSRSFDIIAYLQKNKTIKMDNLEYLFIKKMHNVVYEEPTTVDVDLFPVSLSPTYKKMAFLKEQKIIKQNGDIGSMYDFLIYNLDTKKVNKIYGEIKDITDAAFDVRQNIVKWSKDEQKIIFTLNYPYFRVFNLSNNDTTIVNGKNYSWFDDNAIILYEKKGNIKTIKASGKKSKTLIQNGSNPKFIDIYIQK